jgi:hypothetical protein
VGSWQDPSQHPLAGMPPMLARLVPESKPCVRPPDQYACPPILPLSEQFWTTLAPSSAAANLPRSPTAQIYSTSYGLLHSPCRSVCGSVATSDEAEGHPRPQRAASAATYPGSYRRHCVASHIEPVDRLVIPVKHLRIGIGPRAAAGAVDAGFHFDCLERPSIKHAKCRKWWWQRCVTRESCRMWCCPGRILGRDLLGHWR